VPQNFMHSLVASASIWFFAGVRSWTGGSNCTGRNMGVWGRAPAGSGAAAPGLRAKHFRWGGGGLASLLKTEASRRPKVTQKRAKMKKLPLRKRATKTQRRPANSTGKSRRPNTGGWRLGVAPSRHSLEDSASCAPSALRLKTRVRVPPGAIFASASRFLSCCDERPRSRALILLDSATAEAPVFFCFWFGKAKDGCPGGRHLAPVAPK
jgi:hypothetical protein